MRKLDNVKDELDCMVRAYALSHQVACKSYDEILTKFAQFFVDNEVTDTDYFDSPSYYASGMEINGKDVWHNHGEVTEFVGSTLEVSGWMYACQSKRKVELLPQFLADSKIPYVVQPTATPEDQVVAKLKGEFVLLVPVKISEYGNDEIKPGFTDYGSGDERIMSASQWEQIEDDLNDWEGCDLVMDEVSNHIFNTAGNIIKAVLDECDEALDDEPTEILKAGSITQLLSDVNSGSAGDPDCMYSYDDLLSERAGHLGWRKIICIHDCLLVTANEDYDEFAIWFMNDNEAEPWSHYGSLDRAMADLPRAYVVHRGRNRMNTDYNYHEHFNENPKLHFDALIGSLIMSRLEHDNRISLPQLKYLIERLSIEGYTKELAEKATEILI